MMFVFDYTSSVADGTIRFFNLIFVLVIIINIVSIAYYLLNLYIDFRVGKFDTNVIRIHHFIYITCPISSVVIIIQKLLLLYNLPQGYDEELWIFNFLNYLRTTTVIPCLICLSAFVIERFCATLLLKDYETKNRSYIGFMIGIGLYIASGLLAYSLASATTSIYHLVAVLGLNTVSCLGNIVNYNLNRRYYKSCQKSIAGAYSLTERYQISDNIHFSFFFNRFACSIAFFTIFCPLCVLFASFDISSLYKNITVVTFEIAHGIYTILTPYIIYKYNARWQNEYNQMCSKLMRSWRRKTRVEVSESIADHQNVTLRNTFGKNMNIDICRQTDTYFNQLRTSWNIDPTKKRAIVSA